LKDDDAGDVAARPIEAGHDAVFNWLVAHEPNNWGRGARRSNCPYGRRGIADRNNDGDLASHKVGDESRQPIVLGIGITVVFDRDVAAFNEAMRTERPVEHRQDQRIGCGRAARANRSLVPPAAAPARPAAMPPRRREQR
jgi:hypothetical protein